MSLPSPGSGLPTLQAAGGDCWNRIGIAGDRSCPELVTHIHCRNCPVFATAARAFFDRPAPDGYLSEWTRWLASSDELIGRERGEAAVADTLSQVGEVSVLIFRLNQEWLAFRTQTIAEVTVPRPVHGIPHRSNQVLKGLVNLRGQLQLHVSLHGLLGVEMPEASHHHAASAGASAPGSRLVVLRDRDRSETWVFAAEEVLGVHRLARGQMRSVPSTLANPAVGFSQAVLSWEGRSVGFLDEHRVFAALRSMGQ